MALASLRLLALCVATVVAAASAARFTFSLPSRTEVRLPTDLSAKSYASDKCWIFWIFFRCNRNASWRM
jgi:hypothetical protein